MGSAADTELRGIADTFDVPVLTSADGLDYAVEGAKDVVFVCDNFEDNTFKTLFKLRQCILGPTALRQLVNRNKELPVDIRPLFNLSMEGAVVCFTGYRSREELVSYAECYPLIYFMYAIFFIKKSSVLFCKNTVCI